MTTIFKTVRLILSELGARDDRWVRAWEESERPVLHLCQQPTETRTQFADRIREALEALSEARRIPEAAVFVASDDSDAETLLSRYFVLRLVLTTMVRQGGGEVYLASDRRHRFAMQSLANTTSEMVRGTGVTVRVASDDASVIAA